MCHRDSDKKWTVSVGLTAKRFLIRYEAETFWHVLNDTFVLSLGLEACSSIPDLVAGFRGGKKGSGEKREGRRKG